MASDHEPAKILLPYLQRADELQEHEPLVAYNCRLYAMDRGPKIPAGERTKTANALLNSLIKQLEKLPDLQVLNWITGIRFAAEYLSVVHAACNAHTLFVNSWQF
ncbi:hypothetical protein CDL15_Pgr007362 [Punica granatum]|uniref:Vta1/callose synthase N-terminal domain-containing protein n=1 Tax=Punica granatum TaxID=22663 RepID=A0A218X8S8_PUNGR|nr:hypothetical protein CDL15_Pgr007362 [Punica granatum]